jgi:cell division protein FtsB
LQRNEKWRKKMSREKKNKIKITSSLLLLLLVLYYHHIATCVFRSSSSFTRTYCM